MKLNMKRNVLGPAAIAAAAMLLPAVATAHNYTYVEGGLLHRDGDRNQDDEAGPRIAGSVSVLPQLALFGEFSDTGDVSQLSAGGLFHAPINRVLDLVAGASLEHVDNDIVDDTGFGLRAGVRWQLLSNMLELNPELRYQDVLDESGTSLRFAALWEFLPRLDAQAAVQGGDEDRLEVGLRYNFGPKQTGS